jgi:mono/diheme cytochrome c family protein
MRFLRLLLRVALVVVGLVALIVVAVMANGWRLTRVRAGRAPSPLRVAPDSSLLARGEHLALIGCAGCHAPSLREPLSGGAGNFLAESGMPLGRLYAPNLTPGGPLATWSDAEIGRAVREGIGRDGLPLLVMPSTSLRGLSDRDLSAIVAFLRRQPPLSTQHPAKRLTPLAYAILGAHAFATSAQPAVAQPVADPPAGVPARQGAYLVGLLDCRTCHGPDLRGGRKGQFPPIGPDLVAVAGAHTGAEFELALRHGVSARDGHALDPARMPFAQFSTLEDDEVGAIYAYLREAGGNGAEPRRP